MKKAIFLFLILYFVLALLWIVLSGGINLSSLKSYDGIKSYENTIHDVISASSDNERISLCLKGKRADSARYPVEPSIFSISLPVSDLIKGNVSNRDLKIEKGKHWLYVSDSLIAQGCNENKLLQKVAIDKVAVEPKDVLTPLVDFEIEEKIGKNFQGVKILIIPRAKSYPYKQFIEEIQVIVASSPPFNSSQNYYEIKLNNSLVERKIGFGEYSVAFIRDIFEFPVQLISILTFHG